MVDPAQSAVPPSRATAFLRAGVLPFLAVFALLFLVCGPGLRAPKFWDDDPKVFQHESVTRPDGLTHLWLKGGLRTEEWPVTQSLFWVQHRLWGETFWAYRLVNLALHALNGVLLWRVLRRLGLGGSIWVALFWVFHPVQMESVLWITEFKTIVAWCLALLSWGCWLRAEEARESAPAARRWGWASVALWLLACGSKTAFIGFPCVWPLVAWAQDGQLRPARMLRIVPHLVISLLLALWTLHVSAGIIHPGAFKGPEGWTRLANAGWVFGFYLGKTAWPSNLALIYPHWSDALRAHAPWSALPLLALAGLCLGLALRSRAPLARLLLVLLLASGCLLGPVSGLFDMPFMMHSLVADHFQYAALAAHILLLAMVGKILFGGAQPGLVVSRVSSPAIWIPRLAGTCLLVVLAGLSLRRAHALGDSRRMWRDTLDANPGAWAAYNNLGALIAAEGLGLFEEAAQLLKDAEDLETKRMELLLQHPSESERLARDQQARRDLAREKRERGRVLLDEGVPLLERGVALQPGNDSGRHALGNAYLRLNRPLDAERMYRECIAIERGKREAARNPTVLVNYASMLRFQGRSEEAMPLIREAIRLRPRMLAVRQAAEMFGLPVPDPRLTTPPPAP